MNPFCSWHQTQDVALFTEALQTCTQEQRDVCSNAQVMCAQKPGKSEVGKPWILIWQGIFQETYKLIWLPNWESVNILTEFWGLVTYSSLDSIVFQSACTGQAVPVSPLGSPCQGWSQPGAHSPCPPVLGQLWAEGSARGGTRCCSTCRPCPPSPYSWASHPTQPGLSEGNGWTAGLSSVVVQTQVVHDPKAIMVERDLLPGSRIPIPRLPAIFIPTQLTANAGGFLGLRCSTQHSEICSFTQVIAGSGVHFFVLWSRAAADGLSYSQAEHRGQEWLKSVWRGDVIRLYVHGAS